MPNQIHLNTLKLKLDICNHSGAKLVQALLDSSDSPQYRVQIAAVIQHAAQKDYDEDQETQKNLQNEITNSAREAAAVLNYIR